MVAQCLKLQKSLHTNLLGNDEVELHPLQLFHVHTSHGDDDLGCSMTEESTKQLQRFFWMWITLSGEGY